MEDQKTFSLPSGTHLTLEAIEALHDITENISPIDLRNTLMELYQTYVLQRCHDLPLTFEELASHVYSLDCLLKILVDDYVTRQGDRFGREAADVPEAAGSS
ncbi:MAG TPA: hypothetical protein VIU12_01050 [Chryseolinea sp.]